jgi:hypothetical protein
MICKYSSAVTKQISLLLLEHTLVSGSLSQTQRSLLGKLFILDRLLILSFVCVIVVLSCVLD